VLIPDAKIDEIRERIDLVAVVTRSGVELKKSGRSLKGLCPFHQDKSPSFYVWPDAGRFKCFGCQVGGDAISFVQKLNGKSFVDTVRDFAKELGVDLEAAIDPATREKQEIKEATDFAARHFVARLWEPAIGQHAREYLRGRGLDDETMKAFGLGYSPLQWTDLADKLREHGLLGFAEKAGLCARRQRSDGHYDMFRGRVMIPIRSPEGRVIAFGGRLLDGDDGPKYLNSRESKLYNKSEILYGVDQARDDIRKKRQAVLVEGYFDCIGLHQAGVKNAVALCSTALTPGHLTLLKRLDAKELVLLLDGDEAGRKAVERLAGAILAAGVSARVATLPEAEDPDTFARREGPTGVASLLKAAPTLTRHLFDTLLPEGAGASFEAKMAAIERLKPIASQLPVGLARSAFFGALAKHSGLPASELETALRGKGPQPVKAAPKPAGAAKERAPDQFEAAWGALVLRARHLLEQDRWSVAHELNHTGLRTLVSNLSHGTSPEDCLFDAPELLKAALEHAGRGLPKDDGALASAFDEVSKRLKLRSVDERLRRIGQELRQVEGASELTQDAKDLLQEQSALLSLKRDLLPRR